MSREPDGGPPGLGRALARRGERALRRRRCRSGRVVVSCPAPFGVGGLGRHLHEIADALARGARQPRMHLRPRRPRRPAGAFRGRPPRRPAVSGRALALSRPLARLGACAPERRLRLRRGASAAGRRASDRRSTAPRWRSLPQPARRRPPRSSLCRRNLALAPPAGPHARAHRQYPLEGPWATRAARAQPREYAPAERIYVASRYAWRVLHRGGLRRGAPGAFPLTPDPRFEPAAARPPGDTSTSSTSAA